MQPRTELEVIKERTFSPQIYQGKNPERHQSVAFLRKIASNSNDMKTILGVHTYINEIIGKTYKNNEPNKEKSWFGGSELYTNTTKILIEFKANTDIDKLNNLLKLYQYIQSLSVIKVQQMLNTSKNKLLQDIEEKMKRVRKRNNKRIALLTHSLPNLENLQKKLRKLASDYNMGKDKEKEKKTKWGLTFFNNNNPKRICLLEFAGFFNETWDLYERKKKNERQVLYANSTLSEEEKLKEKIRNEQADYEKACQITYGLVLFILLRIQHEYGYMSPSGVLYNLGSELLRRPLDEVTPKEKAQWLEALNVYLNEIKKDEDFKNIFGKWEKAFDLEKLWLRIKEYEVAAVHEARTSKLARYLTTGTSYAAQYGISFGLTQATSKYALTAIGGIVAGGTGPLGAVIYTAAGTLLMSQIGRFIKDNLVPPTVAYIYASILEKIGNGVATITVGAASQTYESLMNNPNLKQADKDFIRDEIYTLLHVPDSIVSAEEKAQIRYVIGDENNLTPSLAGPSIR